MTTDNFDPQADREDDEVHEKEEHDDTTSYEEAVNS